MTVSASTSRSGPYAGAGTTGPFAIGFRFLADEHLLVVQTDANDSETTLVLDTDYSVIGAGDAGGGSLTLVSALAVGLSLTIQRAVPITQLADYTQSDAFPAESHEGALDKLTMIDQQQQDAINGSLRVPETTAELAPFPAAAARASKFAAFDSAGAPAVVGSLPSGSFTNAQAFADEFTGDGVTTVYELTQNPGTLENIIVSIAGVVQLNGVDFDWSAGTTLTFSEAPPDTLPILVRYANALATRTVADSGVSGIRSLSGARTATQRAINAAQVIDVGAHFGMVTGRGLSGAQRTANFAAWMAADAAAALVKGQVRLPFGSIEIDCGAGSLIPSHSVEWYGHGTLLTNVWDYTSAAGVTLDLLYSGSDPSPLNRRITTVGHMTLWGTNAGAARQGMRFGRNYRSSPLTTCLSIQNYGHYGVNWAADCWDVSHDHIQVAGCGTRTTNSAGVFMSSSVTDANDVTWIAPKIEANGSASSAAGGWNIQGPIGGTNRGWTILGGVTQGNNGTDEAYFTYIHGLTILGHYVERNSITGYTTGFEFAGCDGVIHGGAMAGSTGFNTTGLLFTTGSKFDVRGVKLSGWLTRDIRNQGSTVTSSTLPAGAVLTGDSTAQWLGDFAPRFAALLSADQTGVVTAVFTKLQCNSELYDVTSAYDSTTNFRFTPQTVGEYPIHGAVTFASAVDQDELIAAIYKNGSLYKIAGRVRASGTGSHTVPISAWVHASLVTDYFEVFVRHSSGVNKTITSGTDTHWGSGLPR